MSEPTYVQYELPLFTKVSEESDLIELGTLSVDVPEGDPADMAKTVKVAVADALEGI